MKKNIIVTLLILTGLNHNTRASLNSIDTSQDERAPYASYTLEALRAKHSNVCQKLEKNVKEGRLLSEELNRTGGFYICFNQTLERSRQQQFNDYFKKSIARISVLKTEYHQLKKCIKDINQAYWNQNPSSRDTTIVIHHHYQNYQNFKAQRCPFQWQEENHILPVVLAPLWNVPQEDETSPDIPNKIFDRPHQVRQTNPKETRWINGK